MLLEHTEHAVSLTAEVQHSTCHGSIAPPCSASSQQSFQCKTDSAERLTSSHYDSTSAMYKLYQTNPSMVLKLHPYYEIS